MPDFRPVKESQSDASVYAWVSPVADRADEVDVLYVGKAGRGVSKRLREHRGGFINSGTGRENRRLISEWIATGRSIMVYTRVSAIHEVFGMPVSIYSTEEQALCERFLPRWNRAVFPRAVGSLPISPAADETHTSSMADAPSPNFIPNFDQMVFGDEVTAFCNSLPPEKQVQIIRLLELLQQRDPVAGYKIVKGYTGQPSGYNRKPLLVLGRITPMGRARDAVGHIPLVDEEQYPLTVIFKAYSRAPGLDSKLYAEGSSGSWRPCDLDHFLKNVDHYLS